MYTKTQSEEFADIFHLITTNTMAAIEIFKNESFGEVRVAGTSDEPLFCLADICRVLEIKNVADCKSRLDQRGIVLTDTPTYNQHGAKVVQQLVYINEKNLYKVIMRSDKPQAEPFQDWVCEEVLPSIRKTGSYSAGQQLSPSELILKLAQINVENERKMKELSDNQQRLESEIEEIRQRMITDLHKSTIVAYVSRNNIKLDVKRYGAMGRKASSICKKKGIPVTKINDIRWGKVSVFPDEVLDEVFGTKVVPAYNN